jgi:hypothetical protein
MTNEPLSRRAFFGQTLSGCGLGLAGNASAPEKAWIIVALGWEYNDEWTGQEGEYPQREIYYDKGAADAECQRLVAEFFARETPSEFQIDWSFYFPDGVDDEAAITWDDVRVEGFPDPYYVMELTAASPSAAGGVADE